LLALFAILLFGVIGTIAFDDRHWLAFDDAGDVAYERGNYDYAERMYKEALQVARELEDQRLIRASLEALSRAYAAQGRPAESLAAQRAARVGR
jgi:tetratricopeptide (TPR) repeat protein